MNPSIVTKQWSEILLDIEEGADMVMVNRDAYLDIVQRCKEQYKVPTFVYQVSGGIPSPTASQNGWWTRIR